MKTAENILTSEETIKYKEGWENFSGKYNLNSEYHTNSGKPVISLIYRFQDKPVFRAHVFNKRLRKIEPYFIAKKHLHPFWHIAHYLIVFEQIYHAGIREIKNIDRFIIRDIPQEFKLSQPIFWEDNVSVEMILDPRRQAERYAIEDCYFSLYNDKKGNKKGQVSVRTFVELRAYVKDIEAIKQGNNEVLEGLIRKIEMQEVNHKRLIKPRKHLQSTKEYLIGELKKGNIPEEELHDFFSLWEKELEP